MGTIENHSEDAVNRLHWKGIVIVTTMKIFARDYTFSLANPDVGHLVILETRFS